MLDIYNYDLSFYTYESSVSFMNLQILHVRKFRVKCFKISQRYPLFLQLSKALSLLKYVLDGFCLKKKMEGGAVFVKNLTSDLLEEPCIKDFIG